MQNFSYTRRRNFNAEFWCAEHYRIIGKLYNELMEFSIYGDQGLWCNLISNLIKEKLKLNLEIPQIEKPRDILQKYFDTWPKFKIIKI